MSKKERQAAFSRFLLSLGVCTLMAAAPSSTSLPLCMKLWGKPLCFWLFSGVWAVLRLTGTDTGQRGKCARLGVPRSVNS